MENRVIIFIPSNFIVEEGLSITLDNCEHREYTGDNMEYCNRIINHFKGDIYIKDAIIYTEDEKALFIDKMANQHLGIDRYII